MLLPSPKNIKSFEQNYMHNQKYKANFVNGIEEIDLIRSGLDDMMIDGFQSGKKEFTENDKISDFRTAAYKVAIEKIALSYDFIGL